MFMTTQINHACTRDATAPPEINRTLSMSWPLRTARRGAAVVSLAALVGAAACTRKTPNDPSAAAHWSDAAGSKSTISYNGDMLLAVSSMQDAQSLNYRVTPTQPSVQAGQQIFLGSSCVYCHTVAGTNASGTVGPDLTHFALRPSIATVLPNTRPNLAAWIVNAQGVKPGSAMPSMDIPGAQLQSLVMYLESLK